MPAELLAAAEALAGRVESCERITTTSLPYAELLTARAALAQAGDRASSALWASAAAAWQGLGVPWWETSCRLSYAEALLRSRGARAKAAEVVREVRRAAGSLGAEGLRAGAERLAGSAGLTLDEPAGRPGPPVPPGDVLAGLTTREREVVTLLMEGLSNRAIASRLFISEKTASVHVSNILAKLGVSSRLQVASLVNDRRA